jgi:hypothetical protein
MGFIESSMKPTDLPIFIFPVWNEFKAPARLSWMSWLDSTASLNFNAKGTSITDLFLQQYELFMQNLNLLFKPASNLLPTPVALSADDSILCL